MLVVVAETGSAAETEALGAQLAADIGRKPQIAIAIEKTRLGVGRQLAHDLGKGAEDRLDLVRFEPPLSRHARAFR